MTKHKRKRGFLGDMERVVPRQAQMDLIRPSCARRQVGRQPFGVQTMLRIHFMQQCFVLSDPAMKEVLHDPIPGKLEALKIVKAALP
jgi:IS5 family transposase